MVRVPWRASVCLPCTTPTTPVPARPVCTSTPQEARRSATMAEVRCSSKPSSGWACRSRRRATKGAMSAKLSIRWGKAVSGRSRPMPAAANPGFCKTASPAATKQNAYACALHAQAERADQAVQAVQADVTGPSGLRHALREKVQEGRDARGQRRVAVVDGVDGLALLHGLARQHLHQLDRKSVV